jgi:F-type H+-transporting ATPase subunit a
MEENPATWLNAFEALLPDALKHYVNANTLTSWLIMLLLGLAILAGTRRMNRVPRGWQNLWEWTAEVFRNFALSAMGPQGEKYMPFLATCFIYIFCCNVFSILPGFLSPTSSINMTLALALIVFVKIQYEGLRAHGLGYLKHFAGEPLEPKAVYFALVPLNLIVHIIGELAKPLSLSIRLFGNIFGEDTVVHQLMKMGAVHLAPHVILPLPFHLVMVLFAIFGGFIQALIFTMLTAVYISLAVGTEEHGHAEQEPAAAAEDHSVVVTPAS